MALKSGLTNQAAAQKVTVNDRFFPYMFHWLSPKHACAIFIRNTVFPLIVAPPLTVAPPSFWDFEKHYVTNLFSFSFLNNHNLVFI